MARATAASSASHTLPTSDASGRAGEVIRRSGPLVSSVAVDQCRSLDGCAQRRRHAGDEPRPRAVVPQRQPFEFDAAGKDVARQRNARVRNLA